jgi:hypothetical protein
MQPWNYFLQDKSPLLLTVTKMLAMMKMLAMLKMKVTIQK